MTSRFKIMSNARHLRAPACRKTVVSSSSCRSVKSEMDYPRQSVLPTLFGEKICHAPCSTRATLQLDMTKLGFEQKQLDDFMKAISTCRTGWCSSPVRRVRARPRLRSTPPCQELNTIDRVTSRPQKIRLSTTLLGINQVQMHEDVGLNFAAALRSFLAPRSKHHHGRRDP